MNGLAYHLDPLRGLDGLTTAAQDLPEPGPNQVVIELLAASLNRRDLMLMDGDYPLPATPGIIPLSDGVGKVIAAVQELTGGDGVEHVVDTVGLPTLSKSVRSGGYNAQITMIGAMPTSVAEPVSEVFGTQYVSIRRIAVGSRTDFEAMNRAISEHRTRPVIDRVFPLDDAVQAYRYFRDDDPFGKVVVRMS
ncbi:zinc-binding dehydrogenase [Nocardia ninae]|uniref:Alcohol dehydrogenase n=1 Tax=Nocardia ninae NBRC 108245 TaxID=1210091 RepID=A0A511MIZ1_9NOCA|nr:zinc-binding dehydrogenase [Nocardia ninae]GEM40612.1 hypothetical protein NN4_51310 [Nocardia ninae NBRC 108245]